MCFSSTFDFDHFLLSFRNTIVGVQLSHSVGPDIFVGTQLDDVWSVTLFLVRFHCLTGCIDLQPKRSQHCLPLFPRSSFSTSFGASCRSVSTAIRNQAFFGSSDCCLIMATCCKFRNGLTRHRQTATRYSFSWWCGFFDRVRFWTKLFNFLGHHG